MRVSLPKVLFLAALSCAAPVEGLSPEADYRALPSHYGIIYEQVTFQSRDSVSIHGWFFPAQDTIGVANQYVGRLIPMPEDMRSAPRDYRPVDTLPRPTIVVCNGDAANMTFLILYAYHFFTHGFNVLTFDWRGFGASGAWPIDADQLVYSEFLLDYDAAIDFAKARPESDSSRTGLFGFSTGAYLSLAMAARRDDIRAVVCRGIPTSFDDVVPILEELAPDRPLHVPGDYPLELLPVHAAHDVTAAVLLVVGEEDDRTPPWMSQAVYDRLAGPKELWIVPGAAHGGGSAPEYMNYPEFFERTRSFLEQHLAVKEHVDAIATTDLIATLPGSSFEWVGAEGVSDKALIKVPVELDGQQYWFQLDTGSDITMLYGRKESERRGWKESKQWFVRVPRVRVGGMPVASAEIFIKENAGVGGETAGTLGLDWLGGKLVVLDLPRQRFCVVPLKDVPPQILDRTQFVPAEVRDNKLFVRVKAGGEELKGIFFDTGSSSFPLVVDLDLWQRLTGKTGQDDATTVLEVSSWGKKVPMVGAEMQGALEIGSVRMDRPMVYYWGNQPRFFEQWPFPAIGLLGNALFFDEVVIIDLGQPTRFGILR